MVNLIYHCKDSSLSMEEVFEDIFEHLTSNKVRFSKWDIRKNAMKYAQSKYGCQVDATYPIEATSNKDQGYIELLLLLFGTSWYADLVDDHLDWKTNSIGTLIAKNQYEMKICAERLLNKHYGRRIDDFFTLKEDTVSLMDISQLFSVMNVAALMKEHDLLYLTMNLEPNDKRRYITLLSKHQGHE